MILPKSDMDMTRLKAAGIAAIILAMAGLEIVPTPVGAAESAHRFWPSWRGPHLDGTSRTADPPLEWSEDSGIEWKVEVAGRGLASPIVWENRIFLLTSVAVEPERYEHNRQVAERKQENREWPPDVAPVEQRFVALAIDRQSGEVVWERTTAQLVPSESHYIDSSWASGSPVTDGEVLIAHFGSNGTFAFDLDGAPLWSRDLGDMKTRNGFGEGSSPTIHGNSVVVTWDHEGDSFIVALDKQTGDELWRTPRPDEVTSWATPLVVEVDGSAQVVVPATGHSRGYDLATGTEIWRLDGMTVNTIPSPVHRDGVVYLASGYRGQILQAVDLRTAAGEVAGTEALRWTHDRHTPYVPSLLLYDEQIYFVKHFKNILTSLDAETGRVLFTEVRMDGIANVWASPVGAAGRVYVVGRGGTTLVLDHGPEYRVLASNRLPGRFDATPALVDDEIYLRSDSHLYKIVSRSPRSDDDEPSADG